MGRGKALLPLFPARGMEVDMQTPNVLILGGTTEATALCRAMAEAGVASMISFAGRVERPVRQPLPQRECSIENSMLGRLFYPFLSPKGQKLLSQTYSNQVTPKTPVQRQ